MDEDKKSLNKPKLYELSDQLLYYITSISFHTIITSILIIKNIRVNYSVTDEDQKQIIFMCGQVSLFIISKEDKEISKEN